MENIYEGGIHQIGVKPVKTCFYRIYTYFDKSAV